VGGRAEQQGASDARNGADFHERPPSSGSAMLARSRSESGGVLRRVGVPIVFGGRKTWGVNPSRLDRRAPAAWYAPIPCEGAILYTGGQDSVGSPTIVVPGGRVHYRPGSRWSRFRIRVGRGGITSVARVRPGPRACAPGQYGRRTGGCAGLGTHGASRHGRRFARVSSRTHAVGWIRSASAGQLGRHPAGSAPGTAWPSSPSAVCLLGSLVGYRNG
jgi:hypothetical protein